MADDDQGRHDEDCKCDCYQRGHHGGFIEGMDYAQEAICEDLDRVSAELRDESGEIARHYADAADYLKFKVIEGGKSLSERITSHAQLCVSGYGNRH